MTSPCSIAIRGQACLLLAGLLCVPSIAQAAGKAPASAALEAKVLALIGDAICDSHDQCRSLAFGAKACGGPQAYLAWSTYRTDETGLNAAAKQYASARRDEIKASGMASDCSLVADPGAYCAPVEAATSAVPGGPVRACRLRSVRPSGRQAAD